MALGLAGAARAELSASLSTHSPTPAALMAAPFAGPRPVARPPLAAPEVALRPQARSLVIPDARWDHRPNGRAWTMAGLRAMRHQGAKITDIVPRDIDAWCPGYVDGSTADRRAFWVGFLSALAFHESTWNPRAEGGGGQWIGLLQIYPQSARYFGCEATTVEELKNGGANVACAIKILSRTIPRDRAIALKDGRWRGVAADWGPMRNASRTDQMKRWTRVQPYCRADSAPTRALRPVARPSVVLASD